MSPVPSPSRIIRFKANRLVFGRAAGHGLQILDQLRPIDRVGMEAKPFDGETLQQHIDQAGKLDEVVERQFSGSGGNFPQEGPQPGRQSAMVVEVGRVPPDGDGILLGAAFGLIPVRDKTDDFSTNLGLGHGLKHVRGSHGPDDTGKPFAAQ